MPRLPVLLGLLSLLGGCVAPVEQPPQVLADPLGRTRVAIRVDGAVRAVVPVRDVELDRVDADWSAAAAAAAAVVHDGLDGGATLFVARGGSRRPLMQASPDDDLDTPSWSPDGEAIALVLRRPWTQASPMPGSPPRLLARGELWIVAPDRGQRRRVGAVADAARVLGWDAQGDLLFTRHAPDGHPRETLARADVTSGAVEDLAPDGVQYNHALLGDRIGYVRTAEPVSTAPRPDQVMEVILAETDGNSPTVVAREVGAMPAGLTLSDHVLRYALEGRDHGRSVELGDLRASSLWFADAPPPSFPPQTLYSSLSMPYIHQVYDTPDSFNGHWACGPTSTLMAIQHFNRLSKWPQTVSVPTSHTSDYGAYVALKYTAFGTTFNRAQNDASGKVAHGAYGWCTENGAAWAWRMQDYAKKHQLSSDFTGTATFSKIDAELKAGKVVVLSTQLTSAGHIITVKGTTSSGSLVTNDPYGDRNLPSYPNQKGENATYTWAKVSAKWFITVYGTPTQTTPEYKATLVESTHPQTMSAGSTGTATVKYKNAGTATWDSSTRLGTTEPHDRASAFHSPGTWISSSRPVAAGTVKPGDTATLSFALTAPKVCEDTEYTEYFNLLQEQKAWFSDSGQGGPSDKTLALKIKVTAVDADHDGSKSCKDCDEADAAVHPGATEICNGKDDDCDGKIDEAGPCVGGGPLTGVPRGGGEDVSEDTDIGGGCSVGPAGAPLPAWPLVLLGAIVLRAARRRR